MIPSNASILLSRTKKVINQNDAFAFSSSYDELSAYEWLKIKSHPSDIVLASYQAGNYTSRISGNKLFAWRLK